MKSTRDKIIRELRLNPRSTISSLAETVGINGISVRHHLSSLQADGLVASEEQRHGVGRPRLVYSLTDVGMEKFPSSYLKLTNRLIAELKQTLPKDNVDSLFIGMAERLSAKYKDDLSILPLDRQLDAVKDILSDEGFVIVWEKTKNDYLIKTLNCPYFHIGMEHPEVCNIDKVIISSLLSRPLKVHNCILDGDNCCVYAIDIPRE